MRIHAALFVLAAAGAQDVPRPTRLRIYEVRTALRFDEGELQKPRLRWRDAAQPLGNVAAAGVGARRRDRPRAARGDGRRLRPHRRRRDCFTDYPEPCGRDPVPRAGAVSTIVPRVPVPTLLLRARSRRYISPHHAFPFQRGEPCARVFLFQPQLPTTRYNHPPRCKISSEAPRFGGPDCLLVSHWPLAASLHTHASLAAKRSICNTREATEASTALQPSIARRLLTRTAFLAPLQEITD